MVKEIGSNYAYQAWNYYNDYYNNYYNSNSQSFGGGGTLGAYNTNPYLPFFGSNNIDSFNSNIFNNIDTFQWSGGNQDKKSTTQPDIKQDKNVDKKADKPKKDKEGLSATSKLLIGLGVVAAGLLALKCGKAPKVSQTKKLAEKIKFKPAQTVDEAVAFGKNNLGIKNYEGFAAADKDVLNWANEGLTNVSNIMRGNTRTFNYVKYDIFEGGYAATTTDGGLMLNRNFFANIDKELSGRLGVLEKQGVLIKNANGQIGVSGFIDEKYAKDILKHIEKYNKGEFSTFKDKMYLYNYFDEALQVGSVPFNSPLKSIKAVLNNNDAVQILNSKGILTDIAQIEKLSTKEQASLLVKMIKDGNLAVSFGEGAGKNISPFHAIYHEVGHLNDNIVSGAWLNQTDEQIAGLVSGYAQSAPREFIAETFAKLIAGKKLPDEVLALYKNLNGPMVI